MESEVVDFVEERIADLLGITISLDSTLVFPLRIRKIQALTYPDVAKRALEKLGSRKEQQFHDTWGDWAKYTMSHVSKHLV